MTWIAVNGDKRSMSMNEIKEFPPEDQHDFRVLSGIYGDAAHRWRKAKDADDDRKRKAEEAKRKHTRR